MPRKPLPYDKALKNLTKSTAAGLTKPTKPAVPMGGAPVDFTALPQVDLSQEMKRVPVGRPRMEPYPVGTNPPEELIGPHKAYRDAAKNAPSNYGRAPKKGRQGKGLKVSALEKKVAAAMQAPPPLTAETVQMLQPQSALPPQADPMAQARELAERQRQWAQMDPATRQRSIMAYGAEQMEIEDAAKRAAGGGAKKGAKKAAQKAGKPGLAALLKRLGLAGAVGGPAGVLMGGMMEGAQAAPAGAPTLTPQGGPAPDFWTGVTTPNPFMTIGQYGSPQGVVGHAPPIPGWDYDPVGSGPNMPGAMPMRMGVPQGNYQNVVPLNQIPGMTPSMATEQAMGVGHRPGNVPLPQPYSPRR